MKIIVQKSIVKTTVDTLMHRIIREHFICLFVYC